MAASPGGTSVAGAPCPVLTDWAVPAPLRLASLIWVPVSEPGATWAPVSVFDATKIPAFYIVKVARGVAKPRSQAAELKKVEDIWKGALESSAVAANPYEWVQWFKESLEAGQALQLPSVHSDDQQDKAELENHLMLQGQPVPVQYYDPHPLHIEIHRSAQIEAELSGDINVWQTIEEHVQEHIAVGAAQMAEQLEAQQAQAEALMPEGGEQPAGGEQPGGEQPSSPSSPEPERTF